MKKLLFTMFYATVVLAGMGWFMSGSETYALCQPEDPNDPSTYNCHRPECSTFPSGLDTSLIPRPSGGTYSWGSYPTINRTQEMNTSAYLCDGNYYDLVYQPGIININNGIATWTCRSPNTPNGSDTVSCSAPVSNTSTYSWDIGAWGACTQPTGTCSGTYMYNDDTSYNCSGPCGVWQTLSCAGPTDEATCKNPQGLPSQYASYGNPGENQNSCIWTPASGQSIQTRTVVCRDNNGNQVSDSLCSQPKPSTTQPCGTSNSCGGYSHVYVKELNYNQTNNWTAPGEVACSPSVWQFDRSRTSTYGFFSDSAGTIPINVNNLTINYNENGTYGSSSHSTNVTGGNYSLVSRHEESYDFPPAACAVYSEFNASITNNSCVTVITGSGVPGTCGSANGGSFPSAPSANLCSSGTASTVSGTGPWSWTCNGTNGGSNASCSATRSTTPVNAVCGTSHGQSTSAFPTAGLCSVGTPFITSVSPNGSNFFTWTCLGSDGGSNASCNAPYVAMACVPYAPLTTHAGLNTNIIPTNTNDVAVALNNNSFPNLTSTGGFMSGGIMRNTVVYTTSGSYSFTGAITSGQYLKVTINNLASVGQFVQFRETENQTTGPFYGCNASQWNVSDPLSWPYNVGLQNVGMLADAGDLGRGWIEALNNPIHQISAFVAWFKPGKGFEVRCEVCALSTPVTTRSSACENLPAHAIANTTSTIVQNYIAGSWSPSTIFTYNTTPSTSECRFVCETGYNRNGSACVQNAPVNTCESHYGEACTGTGDTLGYGGSCIGSNTGYCSNNTSASCTTAADCSSYSPPAWLGTTTVDNIGLTGDEVRVYTTGGQYLGICKREVFGLNYTPYKAFAGGFGIPVSQYIVSYYAINPQLNVVYAMSTAGYYLYSNSNDYSGPLYYTNACRDIQSSVFHSYQGPAVYFKGPGTSNDWYIQPLMTIMNTSYGWAAGQNKRDSYITKIMSPYMVSAQKVTASTPPTCVQGQGQYYCPTNPATIATGTSLQNYLSTNYYFSTGFQATLSNKTVYSSPLQGTTITAWWTSADLHKLCRGLDSNGKLLKPDYALLYNPSDSRPWWNLSWHCPGTTTGSVNFPMYQW